MDIAAIILILVCIANLLLGLSVLLRNSHSRVGQSFFAMTLLINSYAISNYLTDKATHLSLNILFNRLAYLTAFLSLAMAAIFSRYFVGKKTHYPGWLMWLGAIGLVVFSGLSVSSYVAGSVSQHNGKLIFDNGPLTPLYYLALLIILGAIIRDFYNLISKGNAIQKDQGRIIALGFSASIIIALITNALIPALSASNFETAKYGPPLLSLLLVTSISYAIARHRLFDIRLVIARSVAYLLLLGTLAGIFAASLFGLTSLFFKAGNTSNSEQAVFVIVAVALAFLLQPLKRFFDKFTNRLFYRDAYDSQELLNELNKHLVTTIDLEQMLTKSASILAKTLKNEYSLFAIKENASSGIRYIGSHKFSGDMQQIAELINSANHNSRRALVADELPSELDQLKTRMQQAGVSVIVKLQGTAKSHAQQPGYILLGPKRSGGIYSSQDTAVLEIIADELVIAIQNALRFEEIQKFNVTLQEKIDAATKQLRHANSRLKELDATKDEFISMASHQLRTPLTSIKGYLSMVLEGDVGKLNTKEKQMIQTAFDSAERMVFLIADLLNVSRLQSGKFVIENKPTDIAKMVGAMVNQLQETAKNHHLTLTYEPPAKFPLVNVDETKIQQVVMNFMDNAIYYTPAGGSIGVGLEATDSEIRYTVTDTGLGVPKAEQHHLFSKFYRAGNARKMRPDGTGLGLFMAKKVIAAQGGAIIFKSEEGKGSTFGFSFPRSQVELKGNTLKPKELQAVS
ncbi:MAG TPA: ATP-binding protein [Candidatus Saccharimonadales bacterium]|nr:ATP-binding protein [Candidatus Saccharimonadales bacterium]